MILRKVLTYDGGEPEIFYCTHSEANNFDIEYNRNHEQTHLKVLSTDELIAFYPSGGWLSAEIIKEITNG